MKIELSIIIVNYNTANLTLSCIDSILRHPPGVLYEIIVVDNSNVKSQKLKLQLKNQNVTLIENKENLGFAKANNQGITIAKGKYILLLNSDTEVRANSLTALIEFAQKTPETGVVGARLVNLDGSIQPSVFHFPSVLGAFKEYFLGVKGSYELYVPDVDKPTIVDSVVGAAFLITPAARKKIGILDEKYFMYFEDLDYCRRVSQNNLKVYYLPSSKIVHHHGESGKNLVKPAFQWTRLIPSSKIYHGLVKHYLINFIIWSGQKWRKLLGQK